MTLHESSLRIILRDNFKGGFFMREKMLVTQALDERDLLVKKISDKIDKASFVDTIKPNEDRIQAALIRVQWMNQQSCGSERLKRSWITNGGMLGIIIHQG